MRSSLIVSVLFLAALGGCGGVSPEGQQALVAANEAYAKGDDAAVVEASDRFLHSDSGSGQAAEAYYLRGLARARQGQTDPARADFNEALRLGRRKDLKGLVHGELGKLDFDAGQMKAAEGHYRQMLEVIPADAPQAEGALYRLGCALQYLGQWSQADAYFDKVIHNFDGSDISRLAVNRVRAVRWAIQAGAFQNELAGKQMAQNLRTLALEVRFDSGLRDGRMMRLLRVGSYPTFGAAKADLERVRKYAADAFITPAR
jgi:tetratricopeptide (TPR) repeat protein